MNISVISDLPVGDNLHDHPRVSGLHFLVNTTFPNKALTFETLSQYYINGSGPLTLSDYSATLFQSSFVNESDWPDVQLGFMQSSPAANPSSGLRTRIRQDIWNQFYRPYGNQSQFSISVMLLRPKSRGNIRLKSSNPFDKPLINPNYFSEAQDLSKIVEGMSEAWRIAMSPVLEEYNTQPYTTLVPGCESFHNGNFKSPSIEYLRCMAQTLTSSAAHLVGTCKMGALNDKSAVVDPKLRVRGVSKLRVIDASIMPRVVSANTHAATVMIGEYGTHLILNDYD